MLFGFGNRRAEPAAAVVADAVAARVEGKRIPPDKTAVMAGNKRDRERVPLAGQVRGEVMVFQPMTILDISNGGAQIETAFPLLLDSLHEFRLTLGDLSVVVKGRIAHCHVGDLEEERVGYRTGVEFVDPPEHAQQAIREFVASLKAQRAAKKVSGTF
jgi:hypothetical protein